MLKERRIVFSGFVALIAGLALGATAFAATTLQIGASGKTFASNAVACAPNASGDLAPVIDAGLYQPRANAKATVSLNGTDVATVTTANPVSKVWLRDGTNTVVVALNKKTADSYTLSVPA